MKTANQQTFRSLVLGTAAVLAPAVLLLAGCGGSDAGPQPDGPPPNGNAATGQDVDAEAAESRNLPDVPLLDEETRKDLRHVRRRNILLKTALLDPFPWPELLADYYIRSEVLKEADEESRELWSALRHSRRPLDAVLEDFVAQQHARLSPGERSRKAEDLRPLAEELRLIHAFVSSYEQVAVTPESYLRAVRDDQLRKLFRGAFDEFRRQGQNPAEATLRAAVKARGQRDGQGITEEDERDIRALDEWTDAVVQFDGWLRDRFLNLRRNEQDPNLMDIDGGLQVPRTLVNNYFMDRSYVLCEATAALAAADVFQVDLTLGRPYSEGERRAMNNIGRVQVEPGYGPPTLEEVRLAVLREMEVGGGEILDERTVSMPMNNPLLDPQSRRALARLDLHWHFRILDVSWVQGDDGRPLPPQRTESGAWQVRYRLRQHFSVPRYEGLLHPLVAQVAEGAVAAAAWSEGENVFELTDRGWRSPSIAENVEAWRRELKAFRQMNEALQEALMGR